MILLQIEKKQYSRRNCLILHGLEEESNGNTNQRVLDVLSQSMGETIYIQDIDQTHRLPRKTPGEKSRPVIVKFLRYNTRDLIYKNKKKLKGSRISITENVTAKRIRILQRAREDDRFIYRDAVSKEFTCIIIKVYYHDTLGCLKWKEKLCWLLFFIFILPLLFVLGNKMHLLFFLMSVYLESTFN